MTSGKVVISLVTFVTTSGKIVISIVTSVITIGKVVIASGKIGTKLDTFATTAG